NGPAEGFKPLFRSSPVIDLIGPVYSKGEGADLVLGLRVEQKHCNMRGTLHGGILATLADVALGYAIAFSSKPPTGLVTANLTLDFAGTAKIGDWLEAKVDVQKKGSRLAFANCYISVGDGRRARGRDQHLADVCRAGATRAGEAICAHDALCCRRHFRHRRSPDAVERRCHRGPRRCARRLRPVRLRPEPARH